MPKFAWLWPLGAATCEVTPGHRPHSYGRFRCIAASLACLTATGRTVRTKSRARLLLGRNCIQTPPNLATLYPTDLQLRIQPNLAKYYCSTRTMNCQNQIRTVHQLPPPWVPPIGGIPGWRGRWWWIATRAGCRPTRSETRRRHNGLFRNSNTTHAK